MANQTDLRNQQIQNQMRNELNLLIHKRNGEAATRPPTTRLSEPQAGLDTHEFLKRPCRSPRRSDLLQANTVSSARALVSRPASLSGLPEAGRPKAAQPHLQLARKKQASCRQVFPQNERNRGSSAAHTTDALVVETTPSRPKVFVKAAKEPSFKKTENCYNNHIRAALVFHTCATRVPLRAPHEIHCKFLYETHTRFRNCFNTK